MPPPDKTGRMTIFIEFLTINLPDGELVRQFAEGVPWIRMPLPFQWLLEDSDG